MTSRLMRGYFHRDLSRTEAEKLLRESQTSGTFLVRTSKTKTDAYVLSVRRINGEILHRHIQRTNDGFVLADTHDVFPNLYKLIDYYRQNSYELSDTKINEPIALTHPILAATPTTEKYYHGAISHFHVMVLLEKCDLNGTFLVRDSETDLGDYVICMKIADDMFNVKIKQNKGYFYLEGRTPTNEQFDQFKTLDELIYFYQKQNLLVGTNRMKFRLTQPHIHNAFVVRDIHQRCDYLSRTFITPSGTRTGFSLEFEWLNIQSESQSNQYHKREGEKSENRMRNRFRNILPYDETRVVLKNYPLTDYMNANRIRSPFENFRREYIAAQGPLTSTINDFWHMVQQESVTCIVMITRETENAKSKCARYWPELNTKKQYGSVLVENTGETNYGQPTNVTHSSRTLRNMSSLPQVQTDADCSYRLRMLRITTEDGRQWNIQHWQYLTWSDHDSPLSSTTRDQSQLSSLLEFFKRLAHYNETASAPIIVHCSAGIGRSGATIAIDMLLHYIDYEGFNAEIDITGLVKYLRTKRSGLVQTERQYESIYRLLEYYFEQCQQASNPNIKQA